MRDRPKLIRIGPLTSTCLALFLIVFAMLPSAACWKSRDANTKAEDLNARAWLKPWPGSFDWVESEYCRTPSGAGLSKAIRLLRHQAFVPLTEAQIVELIGSGGDDHRDGRPYLLRAVGNDRSLPPDVFFRSNGEVWVAGGVNKPFGGVLLQRRAVVAWLHSPPREVYVTFVVAR